MDVPGYIAKYYRPGKSPLFGDDRWFTFPEFHIEVSLRLSIFRRIGDGPALDLLEVVTVEIEEGHREQGHFTRFIAMCEESAVGTGLDGVFVENPEDFLAKFLATKRGYVRQNPFDDTECMVLVFQKVES